MSKARRRTVKGLVVLGSILAFLSVFAIWIERQALNTDDWVATSGRLIQNEKIRTAVSDYLVDQLYENVNVEKELEEILPGDTKDLAGPASGGLRQVAGTGAEKVLETGTAQSLWEDANRTAHEQLIAVLENKKEAVETANGEVTLNLGSLVTNLAKQVGIGQNLAEKLPPDAGQIKILQSDQLKTAQNIALAIKGSALILSLLTFLVFALAMYLTRGGRFVTVLFSGIGLIAAGLAVIIARHIAGGIIIDQLVTVQSVKPAAEDAWGIATSLMVSIATTVVVVGALFVAAGWLASPTRVAREARRGMAPVLQRYAPWVYAGLAVVFGIYLLSSSGIGLRSFLTTLVVAGMAAFGIHELRRQTLEEFPDASFAGVFGSTRERVVSAYRESGIGERVSEQTSRIRLPEVRLPERGETDGEPPAQGGPAQGEAPAGAEAPTREAPTRAIDQEDARLERLERLGELRDKGVLTAEEFAAEKARVLGHDA
ncbi:MAG: SHOCT domain-containing protein [Solirubrobacterales bacterium]